MKKPTCDSCSFWIVLSLSFCLASQTAWAGPDEQQFSEIVTQWEADFDEFMKAPGRLGFHFTDLPEIREFASYKRLISSKQPGVEDDMMKWCGKYPYTPARLCMAIVICDRKGWDPFTLVKHYYPSGDRFRIPDAVQRMLIVARDDESKIERSVLKAGENMTE